MFENNQEQVAEEASDISRSGGYSSGQRKCVLTTNVAESKDYLNPGLFDDVRVIDKVT